MPLYMDIHNLPEGTTAEDVAKAHAKDMETQQKYGVEYHKYWVNEKTGKVFCLVHAPNAEAAECVHREAHGLLAEKIIEVEPDVAEVFLGGTETNSVGAVLLPGGGADARDPGIRTVLFTDIANSTSLTQSLGDEAALALLGVHDTIVRAALSDLGGREVKHTGDGIMASFVSAAGAVRCAIQIQRELDKYAQANPERPLKVRVGAAAGEPVEQRNDLFGSTVQLASRLCAHAQPEQILVSNAIPDLCIGKGLVFEELGEIALKGFGQPVRAHAAAWKQVTVGALHALVLTALLVCAFSALPSRAAAGDMPQDVSIVQLLATPEKFDGKLVRVIGFLCLAFEGDAVYLHREDFDHSLTQNALWVDVPEKRDETSAESTFCLRARSMPAITATWAYSEVRSAKLLV